MATSPRQATQHRFDLSGLLDNMQAQTAEGVTAKAGQVRLGAALSKAAGPNKCINRSARTRVRMLASERRAPGYTHR